MFLCFFNVFSTFCIAAFSSFLPKWHYAFQFYIAIFYFLSLSFFQHHGDTPLKTSLFRTDHHYSYQGSFTKKYARSAVGVAYLGDWTSGISAGAKQAILDIVKLVSFGNLSYVVM